MTNSKHEPGNSGEAQLTDDLERNPGIGQSGGAFARGGNLEDAEGENTIEGDTANDPTATGKVGDNLGRTNK